MLSRLVNLCKLFLIDLGACCMHVFELCVQPRWFPWCSLQNPAVIVLTLHNNSHDLILTVCWIQGLGEVHEGQNTAEITAKE